MLLSFGYLRKSLLQRLSVSSVLPEKRVGLHSIFNPPAVFGMSELNALE